MLRSILTLKKWVIIHPSRLSCETLLFTREIFKVIVPNIIDSPTKLFHSLMVEARLKALVLRVGARAWGLFWTAHKDSDENLNNKHRKERHAKQVRSHPSRGHVISSFNTFTHLDTIKHQRAQDIGSDEDDFNRSHYIRFNKCHFMYSLI